MGSRVMLAGVLIAGLSLVLWGCGGEGSAVASIAINPDEVTVAQRGTVQLAASVYDEQGGRMSDRPLNWASSNTQVVTVSQDGFLQSNRAGSAVVTAEANGVTASVPVTVTPVATGITVTPNPATVAQGATLQLVAMVTDLDGEPIPGAFIFYTSTNEGLATVSTTGLVDPVGPIGTVDISISHATIFVTVPVTITP